MTYSFKCWGYNSGQSQSSGRVRVGKKIDPLVSTLKPGLGLHGVTLTGDKGRGVVLGYDGPEV